MPLQVVGQRAEKDVTSDSIIGLVVDGPYFELHGLETAEGLHDQAQLFVGGDYFARSHLLFGHFTTDNVTAIEEFFGHDLVLVKVPREPSIEHIPADEFAHLGTLQHPPTRAPSVFALARRFELAILSSSARVRSRSRSRVLASRPALCGLRHRQ